MMAVYNMTLTESAFIAVIIDFPDEILWVLLAQRVIRINAGMNENAMLVHVHQWQLLDPLQMLFGAYQYGPALRWRIKSHRTV
jgi:hypothetical protein